MAAGEEFGAADVFVGCAVVGLAEAERWVCLCGGYGEEGGEDGEIGEGGWGVHCWLLLGYLGRM